MTYDHKPELLNPTRVAAKLLGKHDSDDDTRAARVIIDLLNLAYAQSSLIIAYRLHRRASENTVETIGRLSYLLD